MKKFDLENCCGCGACYNVCPKKAITMKENEEGFKYPEVNMDICVNCKLCEKACPVLKSVEEIRIIPKAYACYNKNEEIRKNSSSGGLFTSIAQYVLNNNGVVYGASFNEKWEVEHIRIESIENLNKLRTSKYVQSDTKDTYTLVKNDLEKGKNVLFTGTPCQIEGMIEYLGKEYDNLYTQDIICHGVPSPKVWKKYLEYRKDNKSYEIKKINFRDKRSGWSTYSMLIDYDVNKYNELHDNDIFMKAFLSDLSLRNSCYNCKFKGLHRRSDITLADFWGIDNIFPEMNQKNLGISLVIVNTKKGMKIFKSLDNIVAKEVDFRKSIYYNPSYEKTPKKPKNREKFFDTINKESFEQCVNKNIKNPGIIYKFFLKFKHFIKKILYNIKKVIKNNIQEL